MHLHLYSFPTRRSSDLPSCGAKLEYLKVVQLNSPFSCPNCRAELCVPRLYGLLGFWLSLANSVLLSIAIGLRGLYLLLGVLLMRSEEHTSELQSPDHLV